MCTVHRIPWQDPSTKLLPTDDRRGVATHECENLAEASDYGCRRYNMDLQRRRRPRMPLTVSDTLPLTRESRLRSSRARSRGTRRSRRSHRAWRDTGSMPAITVVKTGSGTHCVVSTPSITDARWPTVQLGQVATASEHGCWEAALNAEPNATKSQVGWASQLFTSNPPGCRTSPSSARSSRDRRCRDIARGRPPSRRYSPAPPEMPLCADGRA